MSRQLERYLHPQIVDHIASNYVLGTLPTLVRRRTERLCDDERFDVIQQRIEYWEGKLSPLSELTPELPPLEQTWQNIDAQISNTATEQTPPETVWDKLSQWLGQGQIWLRAASMAMVLVIGVLLGSNTQTNDSLSYVAVLENEQNLPSVVASTYGESKTLVLDIVQLPALDDESEFELWVTSKTDGQARSLGIVPAGKKSFTRVLTTAEWRLIKDSEALLITVEETGGSAIGEPMGEEVANGLCVQLTAWQEKA